MMEEHAPMSIGEIDWLMLKGSALVLQHSALCFYCCFGLLESSKLCLQVSDDSFLRSGWKNVHCGIPPQMRWSIGILQTKHL